ncbi:MAG: hypothetical protein P8J27_07610 [Mariniblastus sp.]|nr:hypothetical protein [Mariniblastus sp.]
MPTSTPKACLRKLLIICAFLIFVQGCAPPPVADEKQGNSFEQLSTIQRCYMEFIETRKAAPESRADLEPLLKKSGDDPLTVFVSERDGQEFIVLWSTKPDRSSPEPVIIAYESTSTNNERMVLTSMGVMTMNESEFQTANFPEGHTAPAPAESTSN